MNTKKEEDRKKHKAANRIVKIEGKRNMWDRKCKEIDSYIGGTEAWRFIKNLKSQGTNKAGIQLIPTENWIEHYKKLLMEGREEYTDQDHTIVTIEGKPISINIQTIRKTISLLKNKKSPGPGGIYAELLKCGTEKLFAALTLI